MGLANRDTGVFIPLDEQRSSSARLSGRICLMKLLPLQHVIRGGSQIVRRLHQPGLYGFGIQLCATAQPWP